MVGIGSKEIYLIWEKFGITVMLSGLILITGSNDNFTKNSIVILYILSYLLICYIFKQMTPFLFMLESETNVEKAGLRAFQNLWGQLEMDMEFACLAS